MIRKTIAAIVTIALLISACSGPTPQAKGMTPEQAKLWKKHLDQSEIIQFEPAQKPKLEGLAG